MKEQQITINRELEELQAIEQEIKNVVDIDKKNWVKFYILIKKVKEKDLWKAVEAKSFTQWVKNLSVKTKTHESIIWNRFRAGEVYSSYVDRKKTEGIEVLNIEELKVSPDSLVILDKINKHSPTLADSLVDKVMNNEIKRKDLVVAYKAIRPEKSDFRTKEQIQRVSCDEETKVDVEDEQEKVTAATIITTLTQLKWLGRVTTTGFRGYRNRSDEGEHINQKSKVFTEFKVYSGTSKKSRRIDLLAIENLTKDKFEKHEVNIHGIEIKVSKSDLINDKKYTEYAEFVDFIWLAIPLELVDYARETKFKQCGIIAVDKDNAVIVEQAERLEPNLRMQTLTTAILKMM